MEHSNTVHPNLQHPSLIPWEERLEDHNGKIEEYLQNCLFRGCTFETTITSSKAVLRRLFDRLQIDDPSHPLGRRQILFWEFMDPQLGGVAEA